MEIDEDYPLHFCAFHGLPEFEKLVINANPSQINKTDPYGRIFYKMYSTLKGIPLYILLQC